MNFLKKLNLADYIQCGTFLLLLVSFIIYMVNSFTGYMADYGVGPIVILFSILALLGLVANILFGKKLGKWRGYVTMAIAVLIAVCMGVYAVEKADVFGNAFFVPVNHSDMEMAAASTALVGVIFYAVTALVQAAATFLDDEKKEAMKQEA